jgi:hypothetical protein
MHRTRPAHPISLNIVIRTTVAYWIAAQKQTAARGRRLHTAFPERCYCLTALLLDPLIALLVAFDTLFETALVLAFDTLLLTALVVPFATAFVDALLTAFVARC